MWITYDIDFIPADSPLAAGIKPARPIWMDVQNGKTYPVFDVLKGSGKNGEYTYPDDDPNAYKDRAPSGRRTNGETTTTVDPAEQLKPNQWVVPDDMTVVGTGGHLHPGGLHDDLWVTRPGTTPAPDTDADGDTAHLFRSDADYYEPAGPVSWDVDVDTTPADWRVHLKKGDKLSTTATYDIERRVVVRVDGHHGRLDGDGDDHGRRARTRSQTKVDDKGVLTHGHLPRTTTTAAEPDTQTTST